MNFKNLIIRFINRYLFNYKYPVYRRFLYDTARRYVNFYQNEQNPDMETNGEYRLQESLFKNHNIKTIFDVGANKGEYTNHMLQISKDAKFYCFEPGSSAFEELKKNFGNVSSVILENIALSDFSGPREMYINKDESTINSFHDTEEKNYHIVKSTVDVDTIDEYCEKKHIKHIDLLKVDTEGHEFFVLKGGTNFFKNQSIDFVQFEFGNAAIYSRVFFRDIFDFFANNGYELYKLMPTKLIRVIYAPEYEKIMYANFIAVRSGVSIG